MDKDVLLQQLQLDLLEKLILGNHKVSPFQVFPYRNQLRDRCKSDELATAYLEQLIIEAEISLENILNFYPHRTV